MKLFVLPFTVSREAVTQTPDWKERAMIAFDAEVRGLNMTPRRRWVLEPKDQNDPERFCFEVAGMVDDLA